ncbi:hypothetical protein EV363DRAFT_1301244 [Boletus edulis]|nr:hypothetical protein EV363DRAFT_1301244 [Boletus edulis]
MSSDIQSTLQFLVLKNYVTLAAITAVVYDYVLTFSREVSHPFFTSLSCLIMYKGRCRPWTWVSTMFVVVRYIGLYWIVTLALSMFMAQARFICSTSKFAAGTSFVPGPVEVDQFRQTCTVMYLSYIWGFAVFLSAADLLMILRVYAMWNRSRTILRVLLLVFTIQTLITVVLEGIHDNSNTHFSVYYLAIRLALSALLAILAVFQALKQSLEMYKATKQWQPNRYMQKLVKDGILYFIVNVLFQTIDLLNRIGFSIVTIYVFLETFVYIAFYILIPRFVISIRELYDHVIRGRFHIDTEFGMMSRLNASQDTTASAMVFVDGNQGAEVEGSMDNSGDLGMDRVHGSRLHEDSPLEPGGNRV